MWTLLIASALAGYGDAKDGLPSHAERELHLWTNAARMDPAAFSDVLRCWGDFSADERRIKGPLAYSRGLNEAARFHSDDMLSADPGGRSGAGLSHSSTDGTPMGQRVARFYDGFGVGENVAWNSPDPFQAVLGWLCSSGHRENLMTPSFLEFGAGVAEPYWTQNFGSAGRAPKVLNMGVHLPASPSSEVELLVDVYANAAPSRVVAVVDGTPHAMELAIGRAKQGVFSVTLDTDASCHLYWFEATTDDGEQRFPEHGSYGWGNCDFTDADAGWMRRLTTTEILFPEPEEEQGGCSTQGGRPVGLAALGLLMLGLRRRSNRESF